MHGVAEGVAVEVGSEARLRPSTSSSKASSRSWTEANCVNVASSAPGPLSGTWRSHSAVASVSPDSSWASQSSRMLAGMASSSSSVAFSGSPPPRLPASPPPPPPPSPSPPTSRTTTTTPPRRDPPARAAGPVPGTAWREQEPGRAEGWPGQQGRALAGRGVTRAAGGGVWPGGGVGGPAGGGG